MIIVSKMGVDRQKTQASNLVVNMHDDSTFSIVKDRTTGSVGPIEAADLKNLIKDNIRRMKGTGNDF